MPRIIFAILFGIVVLAPLFGMLTGIGRMDDEQMRQIEGRNKEYNISSPTRMVEDNLGFRAYFLDLYSAIVYGIFGQSGNEGAVIPGKGGFFFLGPNFNSTFYRHSGLLPMRDGLLGHIWTNLDSFFKKINARGIPVVWAIAPDKATIYGDHYPKWVKMASPSFDYAKLAFAGPKLATADIRRKLEKKRGELDDELYYRTDTHWNPLGAFFGYQAVMEAISTVLATPLKSVKLVGYKIETRGNAGHDLAKFLKRQLPEVEITLDTRPPERKNYLIANFPPQHSGASVCINDSALNPQTALIVHDSFFDYFSFPYRESFHTIITVHQNVLNSGILQKILDDTIKIDFMLAMIVERDVETVSDLLKSALGATP